MIDEHERQQQLEHARMLGDAAADGFLDRLGGDEGIGAIIEAAMVGRQPQAADVSVEAALAAIRTAGEDDLERVKMAAVARQYDLSNLPLRITTGGHKHYGCPDYGSVLIVRSELDGIREEWYPTRARARAALRELAAESGDVPNAEHTRVEIHGYHPGVACVIDVNSAEEGRDDE